MFLKSVNLLAVLCVYLLVFGFSGQAQADEGVIKLCDALSKAETYKKDEDFKWIIAGSDGWIFRSEYDLKQDDFALSDTSKDSFTRLRKAFEKNGTTLAVPMIPTRGLVGYKNLLPPYKEKYAQSKAKAGYAGLLQDLRGTGIIVADTKDVETVPGFFLKRDNHWTAEGARYMAERMAKAIKASPVYKSLPKQKFVTEKTPAPEDQDANDNFLEFIEEVCGEMPPTEKIKTLYSTSKKSSGDVFSDLFGGADKKPEVVLLGTSNSTEPEPSYANFVGFLREYLGTDVKNDSVAGGSARGAIGNYIIMGDYAKDKPKLAIWELSAHYGLEQREMFREIIPAVYGECSDKDAIAISEGKLTGKKTTVLSKLDQKMPIFSPAYYLALELSDKSERKIDVHFVHMGKKDDVMDFDRSERNFPKNNGLYFAELHSGMDEPLKSIDVVTKKGKGSYKAKLCKVPE